LFAKKRQMRFSLRSFCLALAAVPAACGGASSATPPADKPPAHATSFDVVACRVEETNGSCPEPLAGASVKLTTHAAPEASAIATPAQTTNKDGYTFFTLSGDAAQLQDSFLVVTAPGYQDRTVAAHVPSLAQPGKHNIVTLTAIAPPKAPSRRGLVRLEGRAFADDGGPYLAVGASLFWAPWGYRHDRQRLERHLEFLADRGVDYIRVLGVVGPRGWADRTVSAADPQLESTWAGVTDLAYDVYGLRVQWTIFGGLDTAPAPADRARVVDRFVAAMQGRAHKVQHVEVANEGYATGWAELRDEARQIASRIRAQTPFAVAVSAPRAIGDAASWYGGSSANLLTVHLPRDVVGAGDIGTWRYVRQAWDPWLESPLAWTNNEGKGPQSSVAADDDPLRLTMYAGLTWLSGGAGFVLHTGAGVRGGGLEDRERSRVANIWQVAHIEQTLAGINTLRKLLPPDLPNWQRHNSNRNFPDYPFESAPVAETIESGRLLRAFAATSADGRVIAMPLLVNGPVRFTPRAPMHVDVYDPMTGARVESHDGPFTLSPRPAAVLVGTRPPRPAR
jgi:hypothetical protein